MKLLITVIFLIIVGCKSKDKPVKVQIGPIPYNQEWRKCKKASDCVFRQDDCGHVYFANKEFENELETVLGSVEKQICVDVVKSWPPLKITCEHQACSGRFIKKLI